MEERYTIDGSDATPVKACVEKAVDFLESIAAGHPVSVACKGRESTGVRGATFTLPKQREALRKWISERWGAKNLYYSLNAVDPSAPLSGRAGRLKEADVAFVRGVAVDLDPRHGRDLEEERERLVALTDEQLSHPIDPPSFVIDSGGGVQMLWIFEEPLKADQATASAVKAQAQALEGRFGSDSISNLDRLLRLPFTMNFPGKAKRENGRRDAPTILRGETGERYTLERLGHIAAPKLTNGSEPVEREAGETAAALRAKSLSDLVNIIPHIPNTSQLYPDRSDFVKMAYAIKAAAGPGDEARGEELFQDWCAKYDGLGGNDSDYVSDTFRSLKPPYKAGWQWLTTQANETYFFQDERKYSEKGVDPKTATPSNETFECLTIDQIMNFEPPQFLVDRHIPEDGIGFVYGEPSGGKSFVVLDMALHISYGMPNWHGDKITPRTRNVLYIAGEGVPGLRNRIEAWQRAGLRPVELDPGFRLIRQSLSFMNEGDIARLHKTVDVNSSGGLDLIVVDTASQVLPGADENLQKDMTLFMQACKELRDRHRCGVLVVHHTAKQSQQMRGSSVFLANADYAFRVEPRSESKGESKLLDLHCTKQKDAPDGWHDRYLLKSLEWETPRDGRQSSMVMSKLPKAEVNSTDGSQAQAVAEILMQVMDGRESVSWKDIEDDIALRAKPKGIIRPRDRRSELCGQLTEAISGQGVSLDCDGRSVRVWAEKTGTARNAPWRFYCTSVAEEGANVA